MGQTRISRRAKNIYTIKTASHNDWLDKISYTQKRTMMKLPKILLLLMVGCLAVPTEAKKSKFEINSPRNVVMKRSGGPGLKIVEVTATAGSADKAIQQALMDAVAELTFDGAPGGNETGACPPVLADGLSAYNEHKGFFDNFFKDGSFLNFVKRVSNDYPTGGDNVKIKGKRQIRITLIVYWNKLAEYFNSKGIKTSVSNLQNL